MKKLTNKQIEYLFAFTKKHYVEFYDVQVELVDHLANAIEAQWEENPSILFEDALQIEFKKFGVFGFTGLVEQKQAELQKYYNKMLWKELKKFVTIPKIIVTISLFLAIYYFVRNTNVFGEILVLALLVISYSLFFIDGIRFIFKIKKEQKKQGRSWLIQSVANSVFSFPTLGFAGVYSTVINKFFSTEFGISNTGTYVLSAFFVFQILSIFVFYNVIKPSLTNSIKETEQRFLQIC